MFKVGFLSKLEAVYRIQKHQNSNAMSKISNIPLANCPKRKNLPIGAWIEEIRAVNTVKFWPEQKS